MLNLKTFQETPLTSSPFPFLIVPQFVLPETCSRVHKDFPSIEAPGSFPLNELTFGRYFQEFMLALQDAPLRALMAEKFQICLDSFPTLITVRGRAQAKDGRIHTDSKTKIITVLIYLNPSWEEKGGQLRLLKSPDNIQDYVAEVPPIEGTLLAFKVTPHSWHGHLPFVGERRVIQLNWVDNQQVVDREMARHRFSAKVKTLKRWVGLGG